MLFRRGLTEKYRNVRQKRFYDWFSSVVAGVIIHRSVRCSDVQGHSVKEHDGNFLLNLCACCGLQRNRRTSPNLE